MSDQESAEKAAKPASPGVESVSPAAPPGPPARGRKGLYFTVVLALVAAFAAGTLAGWQWWRFRQLETALTDAGSASSLSLAELRSAVMSLEEGIGVLQRSDAALLEASGRMTSSAEELSIQHRALEARVDAFQGVSGDARRRWLLAEAEFYLNAGHVELELGGRWENAVTALELADEALRQLAEPAYGPVRQRISLDLQSLRSAELVDVEGLSYTLGRLAQQAEELPMGAAAPGNLAAGARQLEDVESGWSRVWLSIRAAIAGMISVERSDASASPALTAREQSLIRRQMVLELEMARLGLLRGQEQVFRTGLEAAGTLLDRHFDSSGQAVQSAVALVEEMLQLEIEPQRPDLGGTLTLLRESSARGG